MPDNAVEIESPARLVCRSDVTSGEEKLAEFDKGKLMTVSLKTLEAVHKAVTHLRTYGQHAEADAVQALHEAFVNDHAEHCELSPILEGKSDDESDHESSAQSDGDE